MKNLPWHAIVVLALTGIASPLLADTVKIPSDEHAAYTVDVPSDWKPKVSDETMEANEPDNHVYLAGWVVGKGDLKELETDIADTLKDSLKSIEGKPVETDAEQNGIKFKILIGQGVDKREGNKVEFMVAIFPAGAGKAGIFYGDWDADAPKDAQEKLQKILDSIKLAK